MDISSISSALLSVNSSDPGSLANAVSIKMLDNAISSNESLGVGLAKMMENSVYPNLEVTLTFPSNRKKNRKDNKRALCNAQISFRF